MKKPQLVVDFERLKYPNCGLGVYSLNLAKEIGRHTDPRWQTSFLLPQSEVGRFGVETRYIPVRSYLKVIRLTLPKADLWHMTHQDSQFGPKNSRTPTVLTIHDLNFLTEKESNKAEQRLKEL